MSFSVSDFLEWTGGRLANTDALGKARDSIRIDRASALAVSGPKDVAFFFSKSFQNELPSARPGILITAEPFVKPIEASGLPLWKSTAVISCGDPYLAMALVTEKFADQLSSSHLPGKKGLRTTIHPSVVVDPSARVGEGAQIGPHCTIEAGAVVGERAIVYPGCFVGPRVSLGQDVVLFPNVTLYEGTEVGDRTRIHAGAVIGADGFGYAARTKMEDGKRLVTGHQKILHFGRVIIGSDVEIGACTCIDRGTFDDTLIGSGTKIDNQVQVGHNCKIGEGTIICGQAGLAGSSTLGNFVYMGGSAGVGNQSVVGDRAEIAAATMVSHDLKPGQQVIGWPMRDPKEHFRLHAMLNRMLKKSRERSDG